MCLAVPLEIKEILDNERAVAIQGSAEMEINISLVENPAAGDFVIVHAGFAIETLDIIEAEARLDLFKEMTTE
ncbi:MAG: HypC/HybG/HupF family hydrogenase formation chaperone [Spirochaeta sp.]|nr:HypC/HybG/HupF family hydrogenase formation chaperone [Spirochaeta sp.]